MLELLRGAGPFAYLSLAGGAAGLVLAVITLALTASKSTAAKVTALLCLLCALGVLAAGAGGYQVGMIATMKSLGNVPDNMKHLLLRKGTEESRANYLIALGASALPMLAGVLASLFSRFKAGLVFAVLAVAAWAVMLVQLTTPLPPDEPPYAAPAGLELPRSTASRALDVAALIALMPDGLWVDGKRADSLAQALEHPLVRERNSDILALIADARVPFAKLVDVLDAASGLERHAVWLVVQDASGARRMLRIVDRPGPNTTKDEAALLLTLRVHADRFTIGAVASTLEPVKTPEELNARLAEVKTAFPHNALLRVSADDDVTVARLVSALDAAGQRDGRLLNTELVVGRFQLPKGEPPP
jgi:biopolymer transport protein ExbD